MARDGLSKTDFLSKGLDLLADRGHTALSASGLARALGVTTGSFYWHFDSVEAFKTALCRYWLKEVLVQVAEQAKARAEGDPERFMAALRGVIAEGETYRYDDALRLWASEDKEAAKTVEAADKWRRQTMLGYLVKAGMSEEEALDRITLIAAAFAGSTDMGKQTRMKLFRMSTS